MTYRPPGCSPKASTSGQSKIQSRQVGVILGEAESALTRCSLTYRGVHVGIPLQRGHYTFPGRRDAPTPCMRVRGINVDWRVISKDVYALYYLALKLARGVRPTLTEEACPEHFVPPAHFVVALSSHGAPPSRPRYGLPLTRHPLNAL